MQPSRRSFLFGRGIAPATPWGQFCARLARTCQGRLDDGGEADGAGTARLAPAGADDVLRARALCEEYGVRMALACEGAVAPAGHVLRLDPAAALTRLEPLVDAPGLWRAEAGVRAEDLRAAGLAQFAGVPGRMTLANWLAGPASALCGTGRTSDAGVLGLDVMLADGTRTALGPFGERDVQPLRGAVMQRLVPKLFELAYGEDAQACMAQSNWPARVRLDALHPAAGTVNLSHLLLGHGGLLAWVEGAILALPQGGPREGGQGEKAVPPALPPGLAESAARLDAAAKTLFDPGRRWPDPH